MRATCTFQAVRPQTLGLIGLGAIGGSIARQVKQPGTGDGIMVVGWSPEPAERALAAQQGALDDAPAHARDVARVADLLILAAPPAANIAQLDAIVPHLKPGAVITDVGSVKRAIVAHAEKLGLHERFAGSHPLAGTHRHGFEASRPDLFRRAHNALLNEIACEIPIETVKSIDELACKLDKGDIAWVIAATALVMIMTPVRPRVAAVRRVRILRRHRPRQSKRRQ